MAGRRYCSIWRAARGFSFFFLSFIAPMLSSSCGKTMDSLAYSVSPFLVADDQPMMPRQRIIQLLGQRLSWLDYPDFVPGLSRQLHFSIQYIQILLFKWRFNRIANRKQAK